MKVVFSPSKLQILTLNSHLSILFKMAGPMHSATAVICGAGKKRSKIAHGESQKRGCQFRFTVQQCYLAPALARILCHTTNCAHLNHGSALPADAAGPDARYKVAARLSKDLLKWIERRLRMGITPARILEEHNAHLKKR